MSDNIIHQVAGARMTGSALAVTLTADTWLDYVAFADARARGDITGPTSIENATADADDEREWRGSRTWAESLSQARDGSPVHLAQVGRALDVLAATGTRARVPALVYDVAGETPDVPRFISGDPLSMVTRRPQARTARPIVRLLVHIGALADVTAAQKINRGAAIVALIDGLEDSGQRVEVTVCAAATHYNKATYAMRATVKRADEPINRDVLAFALVSPAAQRRIDFGCRCAHPSQFNGMGSTAPATPEAGEIYIPHAQENQPLDTPARAAEYVRGVYEGAIEAMRDRAA